MSYTLLFDRSGKFDGVALDDGKSLVSIPPNPAHPMYRAFLDWNAAQPTPLVLADQAPPAPDPAIAVRDTARQAIAAIRAKPAGQRTPADRAAALDAVMDLLS